MNGRRTTLPLTTLLNVALLASVVVLAAYLRFAHLDLAEIKLDEARGLLMATKILEEDPFVTRGLPTSVGQVNSPAFLYLLAIPLAISSDPVWITGFIALINTVAVAGCYLLTRRWFGLIPAIIASILFACNPWAAIFSRKIWPPSSLPILTVALLACLLLYQRGRRPWWGTIALFAIAIEIQLHLSAVALLPLVIFTLATGISRANIRHHALGVVIFLASFAPMAYGEVMYSEVREGWGGVRGELAAGAIDLTSLRLTRELVSGPGYPSLTGLAYPQFASLPGQQSTIRSLIELVSLILVAVGTLYTLTSPIWRRRLDDWSWRRMIIGLTAATPPLIFLYHPFPLFIHYFVQIWPATFIAVGVLLGDGLNLVTRRAFPHSRLIVAGIGVAAALWLLSLSIVQITDHSRFLGFIRHNPTPGGHGLTVGEAGSISEAVRSVEPAGDAYLVSLSFGLAEALRYVLREHHNVRASNPAPWRTLVVNERPTIIILESSEEPIARGVAADLTDSLADRVTYERGSKELLIYSISQERALESCRPAETSASTFDGQVEFAGIRLQPTDGRGLIVVNCWHVRQRPADLPSQVSIFNHLIDGEGNKLSLADGLGHLPGQWRNGDVILNYYLLPVPADLPSGEYYLLTGFYRLDNGQRIMIEHDGRDTDHLRTGPFLIDR